MISASSLPPASGQSPESAGSIDSGSLTTAAAVLRLSALLLTGTADVLFTGCLRLRDLKPSGARLALRTASPGCVITAHWRSVVRVEVGRAVLGRGSRNQHHQQMRARGGRVGRHEGCSNSSVYHRLRQDRCASAPGASADRGGCKQSSQAAEENGLSRVLIGFTSATRSRRPSSTTAGSDPARSPLPAARARMGRWDWSWSGVDEALSSPWRRSGSEPHGDRTRPCGDHGRVGATAGQRPRGPAISWLARSTGWCRRRGR